MRAIAKYIIGGLLGLIGAVAGAWVTDINGARSVINENIDFARCAIERYQGTGIDFNTPSSSELSLKVDPFMLKLEDRLNWSFYAEEDGLATLWGVGASGKVQRIFPPSTWLEVKAQTLYTGQSLGVELIARPPVGAESLLMIWFDSPPVADLKSVYDNVEDFSRSVGGLANATNHLSYDEATYCTYH